MPTSSSGYGITAPAAIDPFPIESVLAKIVGENNVGNAANMLDTYQVQNMVSQDNYNYNLNQQHQAYKDQLAAQMADNYRKEMLEAGRQAGGLSLLNAPGAGGPGGGIDPGLVQHIETGLGRAQEAKTFSEASSGLASSAAAGFQQTDPQAQYITGGLAGPRTDPVAIQVAKMRLQGDAMRAAASRLPPGPSTTVKTQGPYGEESHTWSNKSGMDRVYQDLEKMGVPRTYKAPDTPLPSEAERLTPEGRAREKAQGSGQTSAQPSTSMTVNPQNEAAGKKAFQDFVLSKIESPQYKGTPEYNVVKQGMLRNNGRPFVAQDATGKWVLADPSTGRPF